MDIKSINPANGKQLQSYTAHGQDDIERALEMAASEYERHRRRPFEQRASWMKRTAELLRERTEQYARLMTLEMGKPIAQARSEVEKCAWVCDYFADNAEEFLSAENIATDGSESRVEYHSLGPILAIMPWNFPLWQCFRFAAPALMAGNVGLLKHASNVPGSALAIQEVLHDAGFPEGCFQTLLIDTDPISAIIEDDRVRAVTLTGSEGAGSAVGATAGENIKKVVLELGGSDPFIVMPSADLEAAVETGVKSRTINNGESCIAAKRFILHEDIAGEYVDRFVEKFAALTVGDPLDEATDIGPMARENFAEDLERQVRETIDNGAELRCGGGRPDRVGFYFEPTVIDHVNGSMVAGQEETFGPIAAMMRVSSMEEAVDLANSTKFGLGSSFWSNDENEINTAVASIEAGSVFVNGLVKSDPRLPFGGIKRSGIGRELSGHGIREFVNIKTVWIA